MVSSHYDDEELVFDEDPDEEEEEEVSPDSDQIHSSHRIPLNNKHVRSQPSTPIRPKSNSKATEAPQSKSAKRCRTERKVDRFTTISPTTPRSSSTRKNNRNSTQKRYQQRNARNVTVTANTHSNNSTQSSSSSSSSSLSSSLAVVPSTSSCYDTEATPPPALTAKHRKQLPQLWESQESDFSSPPKSIKAGKPSPLRRMDPVIGNKYMSSNVSTSYEVIDVQPTPPRTAAETYASTTTVANGVAMQFGQLPVVEGYRESLESQSCGDHHHGTHGRGHRDHQALAEANGGTTNLLQHRDDEGSHNADDSSLSLFDGDFWSKWFPNAFLDIIVFFMVGVFVGYVLHSAYQGGTSPTQTTAAQQQYAIAGMDFQQTCLCDVTQNRSSSLCNPCIDQYFALERKCRECQQQKDKSQSKMQQLEIQKNEAKQHLVRSRREMEKETALLAECQREEKGLALKYEKCRKEVDGMKKPSSTHADCKQYQSKIDDLEHELGECNVEWGSCEQVGRQKDALDKKRVEEIEKQKNKFMQCNEQLREYKSKAKQDRANKQTV
eukprot:CAMPEP_0197026708 /NCGR_PEP_ID=MMETSP1384-20130603/6736_1 /TAXON_ID=29189 /ORGANISM="Ammonia sp." /LENGTH=550 /DNA_ID=CAMNT_0042455417 /DNA_START=9 /DNA_END=1661 /DNA_ORIENTATION=-